MRGREQCSQILFLTAWYSFIICTFPLFCSLLLFSCKTSILKYNLRLLTIYQLCTHRFKRTIGIRYTQISTEQGWKRKMLSAYHLTQNLTPLKVWVQCAYACVWLELGVEGAPALLYAHYCKAQSFLHISLSCPFNSLCLSQVFLHTPFSVLAVQTV